MVNDYRIEKSRLPVEVTMIGGAPIVGELFLQASARHPFETADAPEVMNAPEPFFPLRLGSAETLLVARRQVRQVRVMTANSASWAPRQEVPVRVTMEDGAVVEGRICIEAISARARVLDVLNHAEERFVSLQGDEGLLLLNRECVVHVMEVPNGEA